MTVEVIKKRFEIDTHGFKIQMSEVPLHRLIQEIISNSKDEKPVKNIDCDLYRNDENLVVVHIVDDGKGFRNTKDIYTLFRDSYKRTNRHQSGMYNLGDKQFFAVAKSGYVRTKTTLIQFDEDERKTTKVLDEGITVVHALFESDESIETMENEIKKLAMPEGKQFRVNGMIVPPKKLVKQFTANLRTVVASGENQKMVQVLKEATVKLYEKDAEAKPIIYELGIPVQELEQDLKWNIDIQQKIPQTSARNVISDNYLQKLYAIITTNTIDLIDKLDAGSNWINDALKKTDAKTSKAIFIKRYGTDKVLIESTTDYRANERAIEAGYELISGAELDPSVRINLKKLEVIKYATKEFGTSAFEFAQVVIPTEKMIWFGNICQSVAMDVIKKDIMVKFCTTKETDEVADYGKNTLTWNVRNCGGKKFFNTFSEQAIGILVHEFGHDVLGNNNGHAHFSHEFLHEMERIAGVIGKLGINYWIDKVAKQ